MKVKFYTTLMLLLMAGQAFAGEPYVCRLSHLNSNTKTYEKQETELIMDSYDAAIETKAGDVKMKIWRSWSKQLGTGIYTSKKIHMQFEANGKKSVEKSAREGDKLVSSLNKEWLISCSPVFSAFPGRVSPEIQKWHDEQMKK